MMIFAFSGCAGFRQPGLESPAALRTAAQATIVGVTQAEDGRTFDVAGTLGHEPLSIEEPVAVSRVSSIFFRALEREAESEPIEFMDLTAAPVPSVAAQRQVDWVLLPEIRRLSFSSADPDGEPLEMMLDLLVELHDHTGMKHYQTRLQTHAPVRIDGEVSGPQRVKEAMDAAVALAARELLVQEGFRRHLKLEVLAREYGR